MIDQSPSAGMPMPPRRPAPPKNKDQSSKTAGRGFSTNGGICKSAAPAFFVTEHFE